MEPFEDDVDVVELNGDLDNLVKEVTAAFRQLGLGATYSLDDGRFITGIEIHPTEKKIVFLTD
jgi:hypothetical protein